MLDVRLLLVVLALLDHAVRFERLLERVVVARVVRQRLVGQAHDVRAHAVEEILRVRNHEQALGVARQVVLQPHARAQIQVVRGLVQQQKRGRGEERARQRHAHAPPAGHVLGRARHHRAVKTEPVQKLGGAALERRWIQRLQLFVHRLEPLVADAALSQDGRLKGLQTVHLALDVVHHRLQRGALRGLRLLAQVVHVQVRRDRHLAAGERGEQVRFPAPVRPEQAVAPPGVELERAVPDQLLAVDLHGELIDAQIDRGGSRRQHAGHRAVHVDAAQRDRAAASAVFVVVALFFPVRSLRRLLLVRTRFPARGGAPLAGARGTTLLRGGHLPLIHAPRVRAQVGDEAGVVRHRQHAPLELAQRLRQRREGLVVQVVRGLVQRDDVRLGPHRRGQN